MMKLQDRNVLHMRHIVSQSNERYVHNMHKIFSQSKKKGSSKIKKNENDMKSERIVFHMRHIFSKSRKRGTIQIYVF